MSTDFLIGVLIGVFLGAILVAAVQWFTALSMERWVKSFDDPFEDDEDDEDDEDEDPPAEPPSKAIDPDDPPRWVTFRPNASDTVRRCVCHNFVINPGQQVMWWPVPDGLPGQVDLFCEEGVGVKAPVPQ